MSMPTEGDSTPSANSRPMLRRERTFDLDPGTSLQDAVASGSLSSHLVEISLESPSCEARELPGEDKAKTAKKHGNAERGVKERSKRKLSREQEKALKEFRAMKQSCQEKIAQEVEKLEETERELALKAISCGPEPIRCWESSDSSSGNSSSTSYSVDRRVEGPVKKSTSVNAMTSKNVMPAAPPSLRPVPVPRPRTRIPVSVSQMQQLHKRELHELIQKQQQTVQQQQQQQQQQQRPTLTPTRPARKRDSAMTQSCYEDLLGCSEERTDLRRLRKNQEQQPPSTTTMPRKQTPKGNDMTTLAYTARRQRQVNTN